MKQRGGKRYRELQEMARVLILELEGTQSTLKFDGGSDALSAVRGFETDARLLKRRSLSEAFAPFGERESLRFGEREVSERLNGGTCEDVFAKRSVLSGKAHENARRQRSAEPEKNTQMRMRRSAETRAAMHGELGRLTTEALSQAVRRDSRRYDGAFEKY